MFGFLVVFQVFEVSLFFIVYCLTRFSASFVHVHKFLFERNSLCFPFSGYILRVAFRHSQTHSFIQESPDVDQCVGRFHLNVDSVCNDTWEVKFEGSI